MFWNPLQMGMIGCCSSRYLYCICFKISMWKFIYKQAYICRQFTEYKFIKYQKHWHSFPCWLIGCSLSVHSQLPWSLFTAELVYYRFSLSHTNKHACANMNLSAQKIYCYACLHLIGFISATNKIMTGSQCYITWICKSQYLWHWLNFESCLITFLFQKISFANCNQHSEVCSSFFFNTSLNNLTWHSWGSQVICHTHLIKSLFRFLAGLLPEDKLLRCLILLMCVVWTQYPQWEWY